MGPVGRAQSRLSGHRSAFGGYGKEELEQVGAYRVYLDPADLLAHLDEVGIRIMD